MIVLARYLLAGLHVIKIQMDYGVMYTTKQWMFRREMNQCILVITESLSG